MADIITSPQDLESASDKRRRFTSIRISQTALFSTAMGFSVILTGVYPYMKQVRRLKNRYDLNLTMIFFEIVDTLLEWKGKTFQIWYCGCHATTGPNHILTHLRILNHQVWYQKDRSHSLPDLHFKQFIVFHIVSISRRLQICIVNHFKICYWNEFRIGSFS